MEERTGLGWWEGGGVNIFDDYATTATKIANLQAELDALELTQQLKAAQEKLSGMREQVFAELPGKTLKHESGFTFSKVTRKSWTYSSAVEDLQTQAKALRKQEEKDGTATCVENVSLRISGGAA
ncbi:MAG: hypothetical protein AAF267_22950 [Deinococcota bacterium]